MQTIGFAFFLIGRESQVTFLNQPQTKHSNKKANTKLPWLQVVNCSYSPFLCAFSSLLQFNCIVVLFSRCFSKKQEAKVWLLLFYLWWRQTPTVRQCFGISRYRVIVIISTEHFPYQEMLKFSLHQQQRKKRGLWNKRGSTCLRTSTGKRQRLILEGFELMNNPEPGLRSCYLYLRTVVLTIMLLMKTIMLMMSSSSPPYPIHYQSVFLWPATMPDWAIFRLVPVRVIGLYRPLGN